MEHSDNPKLQKMRELLAKRGLDGFLVLHGDAHQVRHAARLKTV